MTQEKIETNQAKSQVKRAPGSASYWLITKNYNGRMEVLTIYRRGEQLLAVFSHEDEAEMFLRLSGLSGTGEGWQASEHRSGELISVLYGPCRGVKEVALDPLPEMVAYCTLGLVSLLRERFIEVITSRRRPLELWETGGVTSSQCKGEQSLKSEMESIAAGYSAWRLA